MNEPSKPRAGQFRLIPTLGIFSAVMLVAGGVIGSGIFRKAGVVVQIHPWQPNFRPVVK